MWSNSVNMTLTADRFSTKTAGGVHHDSKEQHSALEFFQRFAAADVHGDRIDGIWTDAVGFVQTRSDSIQRPVFRLWTKNARAIAEAHWIFQEFDIEAGIKTRQERCSVRAHALLRTNMAPRSTFSKRAVKPNERME